MTKRKYESTVKNYISTLAVPIIYFQMTYMRLVLLINPIIVSSLERKKAQITLFKKIKVTQNSNNS